MMNEVPRFDVGFKWTLKRPTYTRDYVIVDVYETFNSQGDLVKIRYVCESKLSTDYDVCETTIARSLS